MAVALSSTLLVEATNYYVIGHLFDLRGLQKIKASPFVNKAVRLFLKAPFPALVFFAFAPIIFYPFRFLTVLAKYPARKYLLAVALGRGPRFFLLALLGSKVDVPISALILFTLTLFLMGAVPYTRSHLKKRRLKARPLEAGAENRGE
jgi:membrane protein YqaA with SNARE-associated domain